MPSAAGPSQPNQGNPAKRFILAPGSHSDHQVWFDHRGSFVTAQTTGSGDFVFHRKRSTHGGAFYDLRCKQCKPPILCPATAKITRDGGVVRAPGDHCHPPAVRGHDRAARSVLSKAKKTKKAKRREIAANPSAQSPAVPREKPGTVATRSSPQRRVRAFRYDPAAVEATAVSSLQELHDLITRNVMERYTKTVDGERLLSIRCVENDSIILTTQRLLAKLPLATMVIAGAIYKEGKLNLFKQMFTIHANWDGNIGMVACALMTSKTMEAYREVFQRLKQIVPRWKVTSYMGDGDSAMRSAVASEFPGARIYGRYFHYAQCLVEHAGKTELARRIREPGSNVRKVFLSLAALPLLPPKEIEFAFNFYSQRAMSIDVRFAGLLTHMKSFWLGKIGPESFSVFRAPRGTATNDAVETIRAKLLRKVKGKHHPNVWDVIEVIVEMSQESFVNFCRYRQPQQRSASSPPAKATYENEKIINDAWDRFEHGEINAFQLAWLLKYRTGTATEAPDLEVAILDEIDGENEDSDNGDLDEHGGDHLYGLHPLLAPIYC